MTNIHVRDAKIACLFLNMRDTGNTESFYISEVLSSTLTKAAAPAVVMRVSPRRKISKHSCQLFCTDHYSQFNGGIHRHATSFQMG